MKRILALAALIGLVGGASAWVLRDAVGGPPSIAGSVSCATFMLAKGDSVLVGHNLDDAVNDTPGMIVVNKRGVAKESVSYRDLSSSAGRDDSLPRLNWVARHGSITYNVFGKEFPDGGVNEAGLYVGEMTLQGSVYPTDPKLVKMYHHAWMQYLLDSFATVPEVLDSLSKVTVDGHCQWHFFVADRAGRAAVVEFDEDKTLVYTGDALPVKVSTNFTYPSCLEVLARYEGFGGSASVDYGETEKDRRFVWAAAMIQETEAGPAEPGVDQAFRILEQMWCGANRWALVYDLRRMRVWFTTEKCRTLRWADSASFDFSCETPAMALDINRDLAGDTAARFTVLTDDHNAAMVRQYFAGLDVGLLGNLFWKGRMVKRLDAYQRQCSCPREGKTADPPTSG